MKRTPKKTSALSSGKNNLGSNTRCKSQGAAAAAATAAGAESNHKSRNTGARPQDTIRETSCGNGPRVNRAISNVSNTTVDSFLNVKGRSVSAERARRVKRVLDQCEQVGWPFRKKLILSNMNLRFEDIPVERLCSDRLGSSLIKLSLRGNHLVAAVPPQLVVKLSGLRTLDLTNCNIKKLPETWELPQLKKLALGRNKLTELPRLEIWKGLPNLEELEIYQNCLTTLIFPEELSVISKLEYIDLNFNKITIIPDEMSSLRTLKTIKLMNNSIQIVPEVVCEMDLRVLDVSSNPLIRPPLETCSRGLYSMRRYYHCLRVEENSLSSDVAMGNEQSLNSKSFIRKSLKSTSRRIKSFPAWPGMFRSISEPHGSQITQSNRKASAPDGESDGDALKQLVGFNEADTKSGDVAINDTLKVIFVGVALSGKTSIIKRLIEGENARIPSQDDRTIGVDIYPWKPGTEKLGYEKEMNTQIEVDADLQNRLKTPIDVKFSMWDFAGQDVYHATHELFFSSQALYVLVWDMGANNPKAMKRRSSFNEKEQGDFKLTYDSEDESGNEEDGDDIFFDDVEKRRTIRALEEDIDHKLDYWVHTIQASAPGAAILPVASHDDFFLDSAGNHEASSRCKLMKNRLLQKEKARVEGMEERLAKFQSNGEDEQTMLIQKLICPFNRPKLIFGIDGQDVIRVSAKDFTGFDRLAAAIVNVATGRERANWPYPVFNGHIGARIPRMRLEVRDLVRSMRERFKVVESGYFLSELKKKGISNSDDVSDALHFLTNVGELSYFGEVITATSSNVLSSSSPTNSNQVLHQEDGKTSSISSTSASRHQSAGSSDSGKPRGFDEFIFLNPRWLVAAVACILRHDLTREIYEVRRLLHRKSGSKSKQFKGAELGDMLNTDVNYPIISSQDMYLLWETQRFTKKAADRALQYSNNMKVTPFQFLRTVLVRFNVFVPVDLTIDKTRFGDHSLGKYSHAFPQVTDIQDTAGPRFFFLPSLLGPEEPKDAWTFKTAESWKTTICHTVFFPDGSPPGLIQRLTGSILNDFFTISTSAPDGITDRNLRLKETLCWRSAFFLRIAVDAVDENGAMVESIVDIFVALVDQESSYCVASDSMGIGMHRLIMSARGQAGDFGSKIWKGGYMRVLQMAKRHITTDYCGLEYEFQTVCPQCLAKRPLAQASVWNLSTLLSLAETDPVIRCRYGHGIDIRLITALFGPFQHITIRPEQTSYTYLQDKESDTIPVSDVLKSVVLVGIWNESSKRIIQAGSGFFVDKKRGFIVSAGHTLLDRETWREIRGGRIIIGVIPDDSESVCCFRYYARILSKDKTIGEKGYCSVDACILQITTRMENDVCSCGKEIGEQPESLLMNSPEAMKNENLTCLPLTEKIELDETIRILGFNQGGEGLIEPGSEVHRSADFARGYVVMRFATTDVSEQVGSQSFQPRSEIVVICPTIGGHSGGPCVNQQGEVIGILSRADPADRQRCYLVPTSEFIPLIKEAKKVLSSGL